MIKYRLICNDCNLSFDSWFGSSREYEKLKKKNFLKCYNCNSIKIEKTLMTPQVVQKTQDKYKEKKDNELKAVTRKIKAYQKFIRENFDYVGKNFAYEARSIHYDNKKKNKGIFGTTTNDELKELKEEGINAEVIPWIEDKNN